MDNYTVAEASHFGMGTQMTHRVFGPHAHEAIAAAKSEAQRLENLLSRFLPQSDVGRINESAGRGNAEISRETVEVMECAAKFSTLSGGLFDITVGPLQDLWDYKHASSAPPQEKIAQIHPLVDFRGVQLDAVQKTAGLCKLGQSIDLGGIGKGYASDRFMKVFAEYGVTSAFSNIGGNVSTLGSKPDGSPWLVGIRHPRQQGLLGAVAAEGMAVVTSGDYERYFIDSEGRRFHHILNPKTGYPAESGLVSVTVVAESAMAADALSTAIFVEGRERAAEFLKECPQAEAVLVDTQLRVWVSKGLWGRLQVPADVCTARL